MFRGGMSGKDEKTRIEAFGSPGGRKIPRATKRRRKNRGMPPPATFDIDMLPGDLNLCNEWGVTIDALDQPWLADAKSPIPRGVQLSFYEMKPGSKWGPLARDLVDTIDAAWPEKIKFHASDGRLVPEAEACGADDWSAGKTRLRDFPSWHRNRGLL
jgi:hypothetical protein